VRIAGGMHSSRQRPLPLTTFRYGPKGGFFGAGVFSQPPRRYAGPIASPLVSIGMPTYEPDAQHLRAAIESLIAQTETRWELFIHDDCSQRDVSAIVAPYLSDSRITFARSEKRLGIGGNWNACLAHAKAPFVHFLFQDDVWYPAYLRSALDIMERDPKVGFVSVEHEYRFEGESDTKEGYGKLQTFKNEHVKGGTHDGRAFLRWWTARGLHPNVIGEPSFVLLRKSACDAAGPFLEDMPQFLDVEYWTHLLRVSDWHCLKDSLGFFRVHAAAASSRNFTEGVGLFDRLRCMEGVMNAAEGSDRAAAKRAIAQQLAQMIGKLRKRAASGKAVKLQGGGAVKSFALRHPLLLLRGVILFISGD
jgi:hypothetical protein